MNAKQLGALLNGIYKKLYERDPQITVEYLKEQIFPENQNITPEGK